jgi:hypothetical protein
MTTMKSAAKTKSTRKGDIEAIKLPNPNGIDLLVLAFSRIGGSAEAVARELGVTERRVYSILEKGVGDLSFRQVVDLSDRSGIPMELLRIGPMA